MPRAPRPAAVREPCDGRSIRLASGIDIIFLVIAGIALVAVPIIKERKARLLRERADAEHLHIASWAEADGWSVTDGTDPFVHDVAERISGLTGTPGDWDIRIGEGANADGPAGRNFAPARKWIYGTILRRTVPAGELTVLGAWYEGDDAHWIFGCMPTDGTFEPVLVDVMGSRGSPHIRGPVPPEQDLSSMLHGLPAPCRLRLIDKKILLRAPGWLDKAAVDDIIARLHRVDAELPRPPGLGPQR